MHTIALIVPTLSATGAIPELEVDQKGPFAICFWFSMESAFMLVCCCVPS